MKIAIAGKGGVGKTLIAGALAWSFARSGLTTIAIDADPSPNLALALGVPAAEADAIVPISESAALIASKTGTGYAGVYALNFSVHDIVRTHAHRTPSGVSLLVMGTVKSMGSGCTCPANSVVRALLRHLVVERDEAVVLDMEAGIEHLGRGTAEGVDMMIVVSDADRRSLDVAGKIARMTRDAGISRAMMVGNRIDNAAQKNRIRKFAEEHGLAVAGFIPFDPAVAEAGIDGDPLLTLEGSAALRAIEKIANTIRQTTTMREKNIAHMRRKKKE